MLHELEDSYGCSWKICNRYTENYKLLTKISIIFMLFVVNSMEILTQVYVLHISTYEYFLILSEPLAFCLFRIFTKFTWRFRKEAFAA